MNCTASQAPTDQTAWLLRLDPATGYCDWATPISGTGRELDYGMGVQLINSNLYLFGQIVGPPSVPFTGDALPADGSNAFVAEFSDLGSSAQRHWLRVLPGISNDPASSTFKYYLPLSAVTHPQGGLLLGGYRVDGTSPVDLVAHISENAGLERPTDASTENYRVVWSMAAPADGSALIVVGEFEKSWDLLGAAVPPAESVGGVDGFILSTRIELISP
jgi:hypothetical protein